MSTTNNCKNYHASMVLKLIKLYHENEQLCDVVLISGIDGMRVPAHRLILSANSAFFSAMFTSLMRESNDNEVTLADVTNDVLQVLVNYCYTGDIAVSEDIVEMLLITADRWQMDDAVLACANFMVRKMDPSNCLGVCSIAEQFSCNPLMKVAKDYTSKHFVDVSQSEEFLQLTADQLGKLLSSNELVVPSEENVFLSLMTWVEHDEPARKEHIAELMANVRLPLLQPSFIKSHVESVCIDIGCQDLIEEAYSIQALPELLLSIPRRHAGVEHLLAVGKCEENLVIEGYSSVLKQWTLFKQINLQSSGLGVAVLDHYLMLVGGIEEGDISNSFKRLNLINMTWTQLNPMSTPRTEMGVTVLNGFLYVVGGYNAGSCLNSVERWGLGTGNWSTVAPMPTNRTSVGLAVLNYCLYAIGGSDLRHTLSCVERYDPSKNEWRRLSDMNEARENFGVVEANGLLYAIGGRNRSSFLYSVESYNPTFDKWTMLCSLEMGMTAHSCALFDNRIITAYDVSSDVKMVKEFDPVLDVWTDVAPLNIISGLVNLLVTRNDSIELLDNP